MSLDFSYLAIKERVSEEEWEQITTHPDDWGKEEGKRWHPVGDALVWLSMLIGYTRITESNYKKIAKRIYAYETAFGTYLKGGERWDKTPTRITAADVQLYIGLSTNASEMSDAKYERWLGSVLMRESRLIEDESLVERMNLMSMKKEDEHAS